MSWDPPGPPPRRAPMHHSGAIVLDDSDDDDIMLGSPQMHARTSHANGYHQTNSSDVQLPTPHAPQRAESRLDDAQVKRSRRGLGESDDETDDICEIDKATFVSLPRPIRYENLVGPAPAGGLTAARKRRRAPLSLSHVLSPPAPATASAPSSAYGAHVPYSAEEAAEDDYLLGLIGEWLSTRPLAPPDTPSAAAAVAAAAAPGPAGGRGGHIGRYMLPPPTLLFPTPASLLAPSASSAASPTPTRHDGITTAGLLPLRLAIRTAQLCDRWLLVMLTSPTSLQALTCVRGVMWHPIPTAALARAGWILVPYLRGGHTYTAARVGAEADAAEVAAGAAALAAMEVARRYAPKTIASPAASAPVPPFPSVLLLLLHPTTGSVLHKWEGGWDTPPAAGSHSENPSEPSAHGHARVTGVGGVLTEALTPSALADFVANWSRKYPAPSDFDKAHTRAHARKQAEDKAAAAETSAAAGSKASSEKEVPPARTSGNDVSIADGSGNKLVDAKYLRAHALAPTTSMTERSLSSLSLALPGASAPAPAASGGNASAPTAAPAAAAASVRARAPPPSWVTSCLDGKLDRFSSAAHGGSVRIQVQLPSGQKVVLTVPRSLPCCALYPLAAAALAASVDESSAAAAASIGVNSAGSEGADISGRGIELWTRLPPPQQVPPPQLQQQGQLICSCWHWHSHSTPSSTASALGSSSTLPPDMCWVGHPAVGNCGLANAALILETED